MAWCLFKLACEAPPARLTVLFERRFSSATACRAGHSRSGDSF